eukprot:scpid81192/ scgid27819/ 
MPGMLVLQVQCTRGTSAVQCNRARCSSGTAALAASRGDWTAMQRPTARPRWPQRTPRQARSTSSVHRCPSDKHRHSADSVIRTTACTVTVWQREMDSKNCLALSAPGREFGAHPAMHYFTTATATSRAQHTAYVYVFQVLKYYNVHRVDAWVDRSSHALHTNELLLYIKTLPYEAPAESLSLHYPNSLRDLFCVLSDGELSW